MSYPIPVSDILNTLHDLGVRRGDSLFIHSSFRSLYRGSAIETMPAVSSEAYARSLIQELLNHVGPNGALMMPTEFLADYHYSSFRKELIDIRKVGTNRGFLTQMLLSWPGAMRSAHPVYNVVAVGESLAKSVVSHHALPFSMDVGSPWWEFKKAGGKIVYLGASLESNSFIHMPEYILKNDYPRPVFFNRPHSFEVIDQFGQPVSMEAWVHAIRWPGGTVTRFCNYLQLQYGIFDHGMVADTSVIVVSAEAQYGVLMQELEHGTSWYDAIGWA